MTCVRLRFFRRATLRRGVAALCVVAGLLGIPGQAAAQETATLYRDEFGVPHIYSEDAAAGLYASGWAQAEDRGARATGPSYRIVV